MKCIRGDCAAPMAGWLEGLAFCREHLRLLAGRLAEAREADADQPEAQVRLSGVFMSPYIPKYYQSHAQCQLGQCREVRRDMDDVLRLIKDAPSYLRNRYQKDCQKACPHSAP